MRRISLVLGLTALLALLVPAALVWQDAARADDPARPDDPVLGAPLAGLTADQQAAFADGLDAFSETEGLAAGLGPCFNGTSCGECHAQPVVGGSSPELVISREIRIATTTNGLFDPLASLGGPVLQQRSIKEFLPDCPIVGEVVPPEATLVSHRITTPLFGAGLIEAIPVREILRGPNPADTYPEIAGVPNWVYNPETGNTELGRFGWKAHASTLHVFAGDAYLNEMGVTSPTFPADLLPQGQPCPPGFKFEADPEDDGTDVQAFTDFMRFLAPPPPQRVACADQGLRVFRAIGCAGCHTPVMMTGNNPVAALRFKQVRLFSDLLLHDMGPELADGMEMGSSTGSQFRTAPLWGLSQRKFFLHDGRADTIQEAILAHGGEARRARNRAVRLSPDDQDALIGMLQAL